MLQINAGGITIKVYETRLLPKDVQLIEDKWHSDMFTKVFYTDDIYKFIFQFMRNDNDGFNKAVEACVAYAKNKIDNFVTSFSMDIKYSPTKK